MRYGFPLDLFFGVKIAIFVTNFVGKTFEL